MKIKPRNQAMSQSVDHPFAQVLQVGSLMSYRPT